MPSSWYCCHVTVHAYIPALDDHISVLMLLCVLYTHTVIMCSAVLKFLSLTIIRIVIIDGGLCHVVGRRQSNGTESESTTGECIYHSRVRPCTSPSPNVTQESHSRMFEQGKQVVVAYQYCFGKICIIINPASIILAFLTTSLELYKSWFPDPSSSRPWNKAISHPLATDGHLSEQIIRFDSFDQSSYFSFFCDKLTFTHV